MATLEEIERALRAADAAGNTEDARRLAQAYAQARGQQSQADFSKVTGAVESTAPAPPPTPWIQGGGRGYGIGARSVLQGAGSLLGAVGGDAFNMMLPGDTPSYREIGGKIADRIGLPSPETPQERIYGDVGEALTGTGLTMGAGAALAPASRLGQLLTAQPGLQAVSTATGSGAAGVTREQGGGQGAQLAAALAGGLGPGVASMGAAATTRGVVRGQSGERMRGNIEAFQQAGATPSVGQAVRAPRTPENPVPSNVRADIIGGAENLLAGGPTSAGVMNNFIRQQADDIGSGLQRQAEGLSRGASAERAGRAVEQGARTFENNVGAMRRALYWQADQYIPEATVAPMTNTMRALSELTRPTPGAAATTGAMVNPRIAQLQQNLAQDLQAGGGQIPYSALRSIRTQIGEQMNDFSMTADTPTRQLRRLYAALSEDMQAAAKAQGPEAERAARRANNYTRASSDRMEQVQRVIDKNGGPEAVYNAVMRGTKDGWTTLRAVMQSLPREGQQAVTAATIRRMGMARSSAQDAAGEVFSAETFLTNWNNVSQEAKRALFDRHGPQFSRDMDRIAQVVNNIRQGSRAFANPSGTANRAASIGYWVSMLGALGTGQAQVAGGLALAGGVTAGVAKLLTAPWAVRWLADPTAVATGSVVAQAQTLRQLAERHGDPEIAELASVLEEQARHDQPNRGTGP